MLTVSQAHLMSTTYGMLSKYNKKVRNNLLKIQAEILRTAKEGVFCIRIEIETYLYPTDTIKALKEFGYSVERSIDNQLLVSWYKV